MGWPSFWKPGLRLVNHTDKTYGMVRTETRCARAMPIWDMSLKMGRPRLDYVLHEFGGAGFEAGRE